MVPVSNKNIYIKVHTLFTFICNSSVFISRMFRVFKLKFNVISAKIRVIESYKFDFFFTYEKFNRL